ncbi:hypothetical protein [Photobacterium leiognathi]|uniref:hypothetical protein n=1 Tax=Photobacterium leiognathi TaxID=553611 RepID=UPI002980EA09|nr:hypothetical protein [Photobacterium leiognathi]
MQPKWLIAQLEEYSFLSQSQNALSDEVCRVLSSNEKNGVEHSNRLDNDVYRFGALYEHLMDMQRERWDSHERRYQQTNRILEDREQELMASQTQLSNTQNNESFWESQLAKAQSWKSRASERVSAAESRAYHAKAERERSQSVYNRAKAEYDYASSQMIRVYVGRDSKGNPEYRYERNPAAEERRAMNAAHSKLQSAIIEEKDAECELIAARDELFDASRQVEGSQSAVRDMTIAIKHAYSSLSNAEDAKTNSLTAKYMLDEERRTLQQMDDILKGIETCVHHQLNCQRDLHQQNGMALGVLRNNEQSQNDLVYEIYKLRYTLENKANLLHAFDAPVFLG